MGLFRQGLTHDLSKYSPTEFWPGVRFYKGNESPHNGERKLYGQSRAWLHHKGRNKHHLEYWIDYNLNKEDREHPVSGTPMPVKYVAEMLADRIAACKVYQKEEYTDDSPWEYYLKGRAHYLLHERSKRQLEFMLKMLSKKGEDATFAYIRKRILYNDDAPLTRLYFNYIKRNGR